MWYPAECFSAENSWLSPAAFWARTTFCLTVKIIFTIFFGAMSLQSIMFYTISCQMLFHVPGNLGEFKRNLHLLILKTKVKVGAQLGRAATSGWQMKVRHYKIKSSLCSCCKAGCNSKIRDTVAQSVNVLVKLCGHVVVLGNFFLRPID